MASIAPRTISATHRPSGLRTLIVEGDPRWVAAMILRAHPDRITILAVDDHTVRVEAVGPGRTDRTDRIQ